MVSVSNEGHYYVVYWYVFHSSVPLHMQSATDVTATQELPSRELILLVLVVPTLCTHLTVYTLNFCLHGVCVTVAHYYAMLHVTMYTVQVAKYHGNVK